MADRSHRQQGVVVLVAGVALAGAVACGSGAVEGPDGDGETIGFVLPVGNESAAAPAEQEVYTALSEGSCGEGQVALDQDWEQLDSARAVLLYEAGVAACNGDIETAQQYTDAALNIGDSFARDSLECAVYRAVTGVIDQVDPSTVDCRGGPQPTWPRGASPAERIDPRAAVAVEVDETTTSAPDGSTTTTPEDGTTTTVGSSTTSSPSSTGGISEPGDADVPAIG